MNCRSVLLGLFQSVLAVVLHRLMVPAFELQSV